MAEKDISEKLLEDYNDVFADIINTLLFEGREIIGIDELEKTAITSQYKADDDKLHEQERDVAKYWKKGGIKIALYGLENQTAIDKDICFRLFSYDGASYRSQLLDSGSKDRYPVMTIVLYFGTKRWSAPRSLHEALNIPEELKRYVNDFKIHVFEISYLTEEQVKMFKSDFRIVADYFVQVRKNKDYVPTQQTIEHVDALLKFMTVMTGDQSFYAIPEESKKGGITMCEVLDRIKKGEREEGREEGKFELLCELVKDGTLSVNEAITKVKGSEEAFLNWMKQRTPDVPNRIPKKGWEPKL